MIEARRKDNETTGAFTQIYQKSSAQRSVNKIKKNKVQEKPKTKVERRSATLTRQKDAREQERLFKLGKIGKFGE